MQWDQVQLVESKGAVECFFSSFWEIIEEELTQ